MRVSLVGIAWFRHEDYDRLRKLFTDGDGLPPTYEGWLKLAERLVDQLRRNGQAFRKVYIDPDTFPA